MKQPPAMFKKSLVSLSFASRKIQVLQLNGSKKKVVKYASVDMPAGLVRSHKVVDEKAISAILKNLWNKARISEKSVGIVVPEFSTYTKLFTLPKINISELDEAVRWQAQEFLPIKPADMIMDWKIVKKEKNGFQVLVVAMPKEILTGYVKSVEMAGLFPLEVETPSLSLVRVADSQTTAKLIFYKNFDEVILIIAQEGKILGSTSVSAGDTGDIIKTASRMVSHYKDVKTERIVVGGVNVDKNLVQKIESNLKLPLDIIAPKMSGISQEAVQQYLIPLSLQLKESAEPSDPNTVNLLPHPLVGKYRQQKIRLQAWSLTLTITLFVWISFLVTLGSYLFMTQVISDLAFKNAQKKHIAQQRQAATQQVSEINTLAGKVSKIESLSVSAEKVLNEIHRAKPAGITILEHDLILDKGSIELRGKASTRQALIEYKENLEELPQIESVNIPISSFEVENNLDFGMSFTYLVNSTEK
jgi:Tfp pilus assembly PilM family ATPase